LGEVTTDLFPYFASYGKVSLAPQGYFRKITRNNILEQINWKVSPRVLSAIDTIIFSEEDITNHGIKNHALLRRFTQVVPILVMTKGEKGSIIYSKDCSFSVSSLPLISDEIRDFTGAGDTYAAAFVTSLLSTTDVRLAGANASMYATLKVIGLGGSGIDAIPTKQQYETFIANNKNRVNKFLQANKVSGLSLFT
jgi:sugar/nucleoside kinase (ribokinase family)